jgi:hypothetical protein
MFGPPVCDPSFGTMKSSELVTGAIPAPPPSHRFSLFNAPPQSNHLRAVRGQMTTFEEYTDIYLTFVKASTRAHILSDVAAYALEDFPRRLPEHSQTAIDALVQQTIESFMRALLKRGHDVRALVDEVIADFSRKSAARKKKGEKKASTVRLVAPPGERSKEIPPLLKGLPRLSVEALLAMSLKRGENGEMENPLTGFDVLARHQAVAIMFAQFDAFWADSIRVVCEVRPEVLKSEKKLSWVTALSFNSLAELKSHLTEQYVFEYGWLPIARRIRRIADELGLSITFAEKDLALLSVFEQRRHLIVHNGGVVTRKYVEETKDSAADPGDPINLSNDDVGTLRYLLRDLAGELLSAIALKFFEVRREEITRVWRRRERS